ncbi:MAG: glucose/sorbosone dehydrogenase-related protein [Phycisphaerales bacterium]|nr:glucose/sorbosone dehydrogenase-related protein [Phycisphaerales bacterium]
MNGGGRHTPIMKSELVERLEGRTLFTALVSGFSEETVVSGLLRPTTMTFAPDGRLFVSQQTGQLLVVKNGATLPTPFVTLDVDTPGERGLIGVEFDPAFATNHYLYVFWTAKTPTIHNRISRFTADPANPDVALAGSRVDLVDFPTLSANVHNGGSMHFGPDGKLWVALGENANPPQAQDLTVPFGKMLRFNKDGSIPTDNPFYAQTTGVNRAIWAYGFRNPFSFGFQPGTGRLFINDVGQDTWEEVDEGVAGANYGWPLSEGKTTDPRFKGPLYTYKHVGDEKASGGVIIGGTFYDPPASAPNKLPASFTGKWFFGDGTGRYVKLLDPANPSAEPLRFAERLTYPVDFDVAPDGSLYVLSRDGGYSQTVEPGRVLRYTYTATDAPSVGTPPEARATAEGDPVTFSVDASGGVPLAYQWQRNGVNIDGATAAEYTLAAPTLADNGAQFRVVVSNVAGSITSPAAVLTVLAGHSPVPVITAPADGGLFTGGVPFAFAGSATDAEDGPLDPSKLSWTVTYFTGDLERPAMPDTAGITSGSFTPDTVTPYLLTDVKYRVRLTATDSSGLSKSTFVDVLPRTADITLTSNVPGIDLSLDGVPHEAPYTVAAVAGLTRPLSAPVRQTIDGVVYDFVGWSDGGAAAHALSTPEAGGTYAAEYRARVGTGTGADLTAAVVDAPTAAVVAGQGGRAVVRVTNAGSATFNGKVPIDLYLSTDAVLDDQDGVAAGVTKRLKLAPGASKTVAIAFDFPTVTAGSYYLLAEADAGNLVPEADESNNDAAAAATTPIEAAAIDMSGTFAGTFGAAEPQTLNRRKKVSAVLDLTNTGNTAVTGSLAIAFRAVGADGTTPIDLATVSPKVKLNPGATKRVKLKFALPDALAAGTYTLRAVIDPEGAFAETNTANDTVTSAGTFTVA